MDRSAIAILASWSILCGCLGPGPPPASDAPPEGPPELRFLPPVALGTAFIEGAGSCDDPEVRDRCRAAEPSIEIAADGSVYVTSACCQGQAPLVWVSRDGGATFATIEGGPERDRASIEGDLAIDAAGNVYLAEMTAAPNAALVTSWDKNGTLRGTVAVPVVPPLDRPWVRAGREDVVYLFYNSGTETRLYVSTDGGRTWPPAPTSAVPVAIGAPALGPSDGEIHLVGTKPDDTGALGEIAGYSSASRALHSVSRDGGARWSQPEIVPTPGPGAFRNPPLRPTAVDESGALFVTYSWEFENGTVAIFVIRRGPEGRWGSPVQVSPAGPGVQAFPWVAAGREGAVAVAWYGTLSAPEPGASPLSPRDVPADSEWGLFVATSEAFTDLRQTFIVHQPDPAPVVTGTFDDVGNKLLDFLQVEIGPAGAVFVAYAAEREPGGPTETYVVRTGPSDLAHDRYPIGPTGVQPVKKTGHATNCASNLSVHSLRISELHESCTVSSESL